MGLLSTLAHLFHPRRSNNHRARVLHPDGLVALSLICLVFGGTLSLSKWVHTPLGDVLGFASSITPTQVLVETNEKRSQAGLPPLVLNEKLSAAAVAKGQNMFSEQYWAHTSPSGTEPWYFIKNTGYVYQVAGENLARDFATTPEMMSAWMDSPTHKANIVNNRYQEIGIAVIDGKLDGHETTLVVQMFGTPKGSTVARLPDKSTQVDEDTGPVVAVAENNNTGGVAPNQPAVLASVLVPQGSISVPPLFTPIQLTKAFLLALIMMLLITLTYDGVVIGHRQTMRLIGNNTAHVILFILIAFLVILFKGGVVG